MTMQLGAFDPPCPAHVILPGAVFREAVCLVYPPPGGLSPNKPRAERPSSLTIVGEPDTPECGALAPVPESVHSGCISSPVARESASSSNGRCTSTCLPGSFMSARRHGSQRHGKASVRWLPVRPGRAAWIGRLMLHFPDMTLARLHTIGATVVQPCNRGMLLPLGQAAVHAHLTLARLHEPYRVLQPSEPGSWLVRPERSRRQSPVPQGVDATVLDHLDTQPSGSQVPIQQLPRVLAPEAM
jgi:hypothetical protein